MIRLFPEHRIRKVESLDGLWEFEPVAEDAPPAPALPGPAAPGGRKISVPSCWEMLPGFENYRGRAWLSRRVRTVPGCGLRLVFGGVSHTADVYLDGAHLGRHYDAFTPFEVLWSPGADAAGTHRLDVLVDNRFGEGSALHISNDYYTYGGITRPVVAEHVPPVHLAHLRATPAREGQSWALDLRVTVRAAGGAPVGGLVCVVRLEGRELWRAPVPGGVGEERVLETRASAPGVEPWSPDSPRLYELEALLLGADGLPFDDLIDRVGFRTVRVEGSRILLNDEPVFLKGFNRHEDHAIFGCAIPPAAMAHDLALMREMGANFVRTSHYPNDRRFLDLCDETGMLVWEESHARQVEFDHPLFAAQIETNTREMLHWHHNHPCIILWGFLNECDTKTGPGCGHYAAVARILRETDPSRPITYAGHFRKEDRCMGLVDVVSHNIYTGWYQDTPADTRAVLDDFLAWVDSAESHGGAGKPFLVSEFGAGAIYGFRNHTRPKLSEEYQAHLLETAIRVYGSHPRLAGLCVWQFCDCRVSEEGNWWMARPRHINDKGVVTRTRERKLAFDAVRAAMRAVPFRKRDG